MLTSFGGRSNKSPKHKHFSTPRVGFDSQFVINHYAGEVKYTGTGFVEKNIETLSNELKDLGLSSTIALAKEVFEAAKESGENNLAQTNQSQKNGRRGSRIRGGEPARSEATSYCSEHSKLARSGAMRLRRRHN